MATIYVVSVEGIGDGSGNYTGYFRPGISLYTSKTEMIKGIKSFVEEESGVELTNKDIKNMIQQGGYEMFESKWIRIEKIIKNPEKMQNSHWYNWDLELKKHKDSDNEE